MYTVIAAGVGLAIVFSYLAWQANKEINEALQARKLTDDEPLPEALADYYRSTP